MRSYRSITYILVLALASLACSFSIDIPDFDSGSDNGDGGSLMTSEIEIPIPEEEPIQLNIGFGAGELNLQPGAEGALVQGTARYDIEQLAPESKVSGGVVRLTSGDIENFDDFDFNFDFGENPFSSVFNNVENQWDLRLADVPMSLQIAGGAYQGRAELGGLSLTDLTISSGASDLEISFSEPNQVDMEALRVSTGAASTRLTGLANARFGRMRFSGGAGDFTLDFTGEMSGAAEVEVGAALSSITLVIPERLSTRLEVEGALANVDTPSGFSRSGGTYIQEGSGPTLTILVELGAGDLQVVRP
ncbi:MAG: toast rack family protein [Anaerolineales bacterium]